MRCSSGPHGYCLVRALAPFSRCWAWCGSASAGMMTTSGTVTRIPGRGRCCCCCWISAGISAQNGKFLTWCSSNFFPTDASTTSFGQGIASINSYWVNVTQFGSIQSIFIPCHWKLQFPVKTGSTFLHKLLPHHAEKTIFSNPGFMTVLDDSLGLQFQSGRAVCRSGFRRDD